jgi:hypothetical protein
MKELTGENMQLTEKYHIHGIGEDVPRVALWDIGIEVFTSQFKST